MSEQRILQVVKGAVFAAVFVALWVGLAGLVRRFDPLLGAGPPAALWPVGWFLGVAGLALGASCVALFLTAGEGTPAPFDPPRVFVASGPYRWVRNPMYVGGLLALVGSGLALRSWAIVLLGALFGCLAHAMVVLVEEPSLERRFGASYLAYKARVRRWLPGIPGRSA